MNRCLVLTAMLGYSLAASGAAPSTATDLAQQLKQVPAHVFPDQRREELASMVRIDLERRLQEANDRSRRAWYGIQDKAQWEQFRDRRLQALRDSITGSVDRWPLNTRVTGQVAGDGYRIENLVFLSRPGLWVTANLYLPASAKTDMPGIVICHSHHRPKEHGELQDMGMTWARQGCAVLVMDQLGHGERRQHPFKTADDYKGEFRLSRQDYYFRYDMGMQLHLAGESLIGWMALDLARGVSLLLSRPDVDRHRIIMLGAVAGGGDPVAVAAALDKRIAAAVPFNFGGPQPETRYPLPADAETTFNYAGSGSWESTRNLRLSAADGFLPWVIVGGIAPRRLVFAHEFNWHRERDPVWKRLQAIYRFYDASDHLAYTHGRGELRGRRPEATHCTHIGLPHRVMVHDAFARWFNIQVTADAEYSARIPEDKLLCMTPEVERELKPRRLCDVLADLGTQRAQAEGRKLQRLHSENRRNVLQKWWASVLGNVAPTDELKEVLPVREEPLSDGAVLQRTAIRTQPGITIPVLLLVPERRNGPPAPVVVGVAQSGKEALLRNRADEIAGLLQAGIAVCLPDVRGTGETRAGSGRGRYSADTALSSTALMLGDTMVGARLRDLRSVLRYLRSRKDLDATQIALWGDSLAPMNPPDTDFRVPRHMDGRPKQPEPLGGLLAMLAALYEDNVQAVYIHRGLVSYRSVLDSQFVLIPHDLVVPEVLCIGDLSNVAAALAPRPVCFDGLVDGLNRQVPIERVREQYEPVVESYQRDGAEDRLTIAESSASPAEWLRRQLAK
jgi:cephalosporin-C deacetylase-like acetyl esterase